MLVGCGSAYYACLSGRIALEHWARMPAEVEIASEFRYRDAVLGERTLVVAVSQSGETVDTFHALREANRRGARTIALTNVVDSLLAREADGVLYTRAGPEIGVASTKCHAAQIVMLQLFALHLAEPAGDPRPGRGAAQLGAGASRSCPGSSRPPSDAWTTTWRCAHGLAEVQDVYFLGRRVGYGIALEGALKLKELAYVRAEAYPAGEMKHGPIALIDDRAVVVAIATRGQLWEKVMANIAEVKARGATVVAVCDEGDEETAKAVADHVLEIPAVPELLSPVVAIVPLAGACLRRRPGAGQRRRPAPQPRQGRHRRMRSLQAERHEPFRRSRCDRHRGRRRRRRALPPGPCSPPADRPSAVSSPTQSGPSCPSAQIPVPGLAARFAAKEAAMKALGTGLGGVRFAEVEVVRGGFGGAAASRSPGLRPPAPTALGVRCWHVSLTHTDSVAAAVVVAD